MFAVPPENAQPRIAIGESEPQTLDADRDGEAGSFDRETQRENLHSRRQDREERKRYAKWIYRLAVGWLGFVGVLFLGCGLGLLSLSDSVLIALATTTTIKVLALLLYVTKYLFPSPS